MNNSPLNSRFSFLQDRSFWTILLSVIFFIVSLGLGISYLFQGGISMEFRWVFLAITLIQLGLSGVAAFQARRGDSDFAGWTLLIFVIVATTSRVFLYQDVTLLISLIAIFLFIIITNLTLTRYQNWALLVSLGLAGIHFLADQYVTQYLQLPRSNPITNNYELILTSMSIGLVILFSGIYTNRLLRNSGTTIKLAAMLAIFIVMNVTFAIYTTITFDELRVTGPVYERIIQQKDLLADMLPPPIYIVESHLTVVQLLEEAKGTPIEEINIDEYISQNRALRNTYEARMRTWLFEIPNTSQLYTQLNERSYNAAIQYFQIRDEQFVPAIQNGNIEEAERIYTEELDPLFNEHKNAINQAVFLSRQTSLRDEVGSIEEASNFNAARTAILMGQLGILLVVGFAISRQITGAVSTLNQAAKDISGGKLDTRVSITSQDEFGQLGQTFNEMTAQLQTSVGELEQRVAERTADLTLRTEELENISTRLEKRANQLNAVAQVARAATSTPSLRDLLPIVANEISKEFGFYHTGIFLLDAEGRYAILQAASSPGGKKMLLRGHRLQVGAEGMVGYVTSQGKVRLAFDVGDDATFFNNPDLPETRSALTLPLKYGNEVIGALDVQSTVESAFTEEDIAVLTTLSDQVSIAIHNAQLFDEAQRAIQQSEATFRQYIRNEWSRYITTSNQVGYQFSNTEGAAPIVEPRVTPENRQALQTGEEQVHADDMQTRLAIPLKLRGEVIGILNVQAPGSRELDDDEKDIIRAVSDRVTLAIENARLVEDSQRRASKEQLIGEITSRIGASINMRNVLQTAVEELGRALPGSEVVIQFSQDKKE